MRSASQFSFAPRQKKKQASAASDHRLEFNEPPDAQLDGSPDDAQSLAKPYIAIVHQRAFIRDCFTRCLEMSYTTHDVIAFESVAAWKNFSYERKLFPTVILYFIDGNNSPDLWSFELLESILIETPVVIVSDTDNVEDVVHAFKNGVRGYIPTSLPFNVVVEAVRLVEAGGTFIPASSFLFDSARSEAFGPKSCELLTERQLMVVGALCEGMANKQIAYKLSMSEHTVKVHLRHIMRKLNARNRTEVAILSRDLLPVSDNSHPRRTFNGRLPVS